ncbi:hypothetical protein [Staphylococcus sp. GDY8P120P]|uniref:hypothetical protein n=1 Tax=Staphylococcus sp. GDY8P120P TaxID=2804156 RepID=UPI001AEC2CB6|nr:hypothetical protein [Staphylococcus sp. GDY8P120P]
MKIRDLNINDYVIVYDLGKSEHSEGMTVVGRVARLRNYVVAENENEEDGYTVAVIESIPDIEYVITDDNYFDLWSNYIESKTESVSTPNPGKIYSYSNSTVGPNEEIISHSQSNDVQQRKRNLGFDNVKIPNSNKTVRWKDNGNLEVQSSYELDIPDYILQDEKSDVIGYLNKQIKCKENNDFIEEIVKNYNPIVAYYVGKSIDNLRENEIDNARDLLNKAFKHWE